MIDTAKVFASREVTVRRERESRRIEERWRVVGVSVGMLALSTSRGSLQTDAPEVGETVHVQSAPTDAAYLMEGRVSEVMRGGGVSIVVEQRGDIQRVQRRRHVRIPMRMPVKMVEIIPEPVETIKTETHDVSVGGIQTGTPRHVPPGQLVLVTLDIGDSKPSIVCRARVVRCHEQPPHEDEFLAGIAFLGIQESDQDRLLSLLTTEQWPRIQAAP